MVPTQWIEIDKSEHLRRPGGPQLTPQYKSRLVVRGDMEEALGIGTDSPTCELEGLRLIISFAAGTKRKLKCADITSAYFQGQELDRLMLLRPPTDGARRRTGRRWIDRPHACVWHQRCGTRTLEEDPQRLQDAWIAGESDHAGTLQHYRR